MFYQILWLVLLLLVWQHFSKRRVFLNLGVGSVHFSSIMRHHCLHAVVAAWDTEGEVMAWRVCQNWKPVVLPLEGRIPAAVRGFRVWFLLSCKVKY